MNVLITGSNGFIGRSLIAVLKDAYAILGQGRGVNKARASVQNYFELDIGAKSDWRACLQNVNVIIHLAAVAHNNSNDSDYINEVNVKGTINFAQQAVKNGVKRFIFISSIGVFGNNTSRCESFDESSATSPHSQYAQSKLDAEQALLKIAEETDLEVVIIRPVLVYGAGAPGNFGKLVNLVNKVPMLPFALCNNKRSFISVDNLVNFIAVCIEHPKVKNEIFCISDDEDVSIKEFTNAIATGLGKKLLQLPIPNFIFNFLGKITGKGAQIEQLIGELQVDSSKARKLLGWAPPFTMNKTLQKLSKVK